MTGRYREQLFARLHFMLAAESPLWFCNRCARMPATGRVS